MQKKAITPLYMFFGILFVTCLLVSNIISGKLFMFGPWALTCGVLIFPVSYILNDVIAEVYGFKAARRVVWFGFAMNLLMVVLFTIAIAMPAPVWFENAEAFKIVLGNTPRLLVASLLAYVIGSYVNAVVISKLKVKNEGKHFGVRAVASTFLGESVDSLIFVPIGFLGLMPFNQMLIMMLLQVCVKTAYEIIILPVTIQVVKRVKKYEEVDVFDYDEKYKFIGE